MAQSGERPISPMRAKFVIGVWALAAVVGLSLCAGGDDDRGSGPTRPNVVPESDGGVTSLLVSHRILTPLSKFSHLVNAP